MTDAKQRKTPVLRFKGFHDDWEQRKLEDISKKEIKKNTDNKHYEVLTDSAEFGIVSQKDYFNKIIAKNTSNYYIVSLNDFVYNPRISNKAPYGPIRRNKKFDIGVMSPLYYVFKINSNFSNAFFEYYFLTDKWHHFMYFNGDSGARSDRFSIKDDTFKKMMVWIANPLEQKKIGKIFILIDNLISLQQRKIKIIYSFKKGIFEKIFHDTSFKKEIFNNVLGNASLKEFITKKNIDNGIYPIIQQGEKPIYGFSNLRPYKNYKKILLFGDHTLSLYKPKEPFLAATDGIKAIYSDKFDVNFLYLLLWKFMPKSEGYKRHFNILKETKFYYPSNKGTQKLLATLFLNFEYYSNLEKEREKLLQDIKQFLLQNMFI